MLPKPCFARSDKTLCDGASIFSRKLALDLLQQGVLRGLVSQQTRDDFPQNIWAVTDSGVPVEAQLEDALNGTYHGYLMPVADPFREKVLERWKTVK